VVKVSIEVRSGATRFRVKVQASSIQRAASLVGGLHPASDVRIVFPIDPEGFFLEDALAQEGLIETGESQRPAA
jgi:hypothetical protein